jgi:hypothetical protein
MAILAHLLCVRCKERLCLGKWLRSEKDEGFGFWRGGVTTAQSGTKVLHFLARHLNHEVLALSDGEYERRKDCGDYKTVEDELDGKNPNFVA